jgi:hypothetical protein
MVTGKQLKAAILARRAAQGPRKKRTRPEPRQRTVAGLQFSARLGFTGHCGCSLRLASR